MSTVTGVHVSSRVSSLGLQCGQICKGRLGHGGGDGDDGAKCGDIDVNGLHWTAHPDGLLSVDYIPEDVSMSDD